MEILWSVIIAMGIAFVTFASKRQKGEAFDGQKLVRTMAIGLVLGLIAYFSGFTLTVDNWEAYLTANAGAVAVVEQVLKIVWRLVVKPAAVTG